MTCLSAETGCLFDLAMDPCERKNIAADYTEIRDALSSLLDSYQEQAVTMLIVDGSEMDPMYNENTTFWGPYLEYDVVTFEDTLQADYQRLYPLTSDTSETLLSVRTVKSWNIGYGPTSHLVQLHLATVLLMTLLTVCVVVLVRAFRASSKWQKKTISEVAPLLAVES